MRLMTLPNKHGKHDRVVGRGLSNPTHTIMKLPRFRSQQVLQLPAVGGWTVSDNLTARGAAYPLGIRGWCIYYSKL